MPARRGSSSPFRGRRGIPFPDRDAHDGRSGIPGAERVCHAVRSGLRKGSCSPLRQSLVERSHLRNRERKGRAPQMSGQGPALTSCGLRIRPGWRRRLPPRSTSPDGHRRHYTPRRSTVRRAGISRSVVLNGNAFGESSENLLEQTIGGGAALRLFVYFIGREVFG